MTQRLGVEVVPEIMTVKEQPNAEYPPRDVGKKQFCSTSNYKSCHQNRYSWEKNRLVRHRRLPHSPCER